MLPDLVQNLLERADEVKNPNLSWFRRLGNCGAPLVKAGFMGFLPCQQGGTVAAGLFQGDHLGKRGIFGSDSLSLQIAIV